MEHSASDHAGARHRVVVSPQAARRLASARGWLAARAASQSLLVISTTREAASEAIRAAVRAPGACFGWHRATLGTLAAQLAANSLATAGLAPVSGLCLEALCARVVHRLARDEQLGGYQAIADLPGLPRALARTVTELRMNGVDPTVVAQCEGGVDLARMLEAYRHELEDGAFADRCAVFERAAAAVAELEAGRHPLVGLPLLLLDLAPGTALERSLVLALLARAPESCVTVAAGDGPALQFFSKLPDAEMRIDETASSTSLERLQAHLFETSAAPAELGSEVTVLSAPGESRECVEIARMIVAEAEAGVRFDQMAVLLRSPEQYRDHLAEAFARAQLPVHFAGGSLRPDRAGRGLLALLACAEERLSASRFAEYLSLGVAPAVESDGKPPPAPPSEECYHPPTDEMFRLAALGQLESIVNLPDTAPPGDQSLSVPRRWERLLVDAAVIGGRDRWASRLDGLTAALELERAALEDDDDPRLARFDRRLRELERLQAFALPLIDLLAALPRQASWSVWLEQLRILATRAIRRPEQVLTTLAELSPMGPVEPVALSDVRLVLERRLGELLQPPSATRAGKILVSSTEEARGLSFDVVFVPGLAEKIFPKKVVEDPMALDLLRSTIDAGLATNSDRILAERLALRLAVGAARRRVVLSYPRLDTQRAKPRVPSFYALEVLRAAEGRLPGFNELSRRAQRGAATRMGWPAPDDKQLAVDDAEYDLTSLQALLGPVSEERRGAARYLLNSNEHLARALRARAMRWERPGWSFADGFVKPPPAAIEALARHQLDQRAYSATALEKYSACPYGFFLSAIQRLSPGQQPVFIEELDALQRGRLIHETMHAVIVELRAKGMLPLRVAHRAAADGILKTVLDEIAERHRQQLAPAIARVWQDTIADIYGDLRHWLLRSSGQQDWAAELSELGFGLRQRPDLASCSRAEPVALAMGLKLRGAIDLVERSGEQLRATDHKTGKVNVEQGARIAGGRSLQPLLYALALEQIYPERQVVGGRLYYCTSRGDFSTREFPLDAAARQAVEHAISEVATALANGFFPASPAPGACSRCDYPAVCGPYEEQRVTRKHELLSLTGLRAQR